VIVDDNHWRRSLGRADTVTEIDFTRLHERSAEFDEAETARAVRERAIRVVKDVLDRHPVGVYEPESGRLVARARSPEFGAIGAPTAVDPRESRLGEIVAEGEPVHGPAPSAFGDAESWCVAPTGDGGGIVALDPEPAAFDADVTAALSGISLHVESALDEVEDPEETFREDDLTRAEGVSGRVLLDALRYSFPDYAFLYDAEGTYLDVLLGDRNLALNTREQLVGSTVWEVFDDEEDAQRVFDAIQTALDEWTTQTVEYPLETPHKTLYYEGQISPLPREDMETDAAVMVARDVTERIERTEKLQRQNERLAEFASVVSHDLRNPLEAANGFLEVAIAEADDDEHDALQRVEDALDRMEAIIQDLLTLAREGADVSGVEPVVLNDLVASTWESLDTGEQASLATESLPTVEADAESLRRAFENLFRNALEHAGEDVSVTVGPLGDSSGNGSGNCPGNNSGFYVADDGPGIDPDERADVFETGYTTSRDGTGFGLSIVRRVAQAHGWTVSVTESADGGARFEFREIERVGDDCS
jgi:PAS domain S-box-containing protein